MRGVCKAVLGIAFLTSTSLATPAFGQTTTYHLHKETSAVTYSFRQLKTTGPDAASVAQQTNDLKNLTGQWPIGYFETQTNVPNLVGTIPSGSTITFTVYMKKTANFGTIYPRVRAWVGGANGALLCEATGSTALSAVLGPYVLSCLTGAAVTMVATDSVSAFVSVWIPSNGGTNHSVFGELDSEGNTTPTYDSRFVVPNPIPPTPTVSSVSPTSGPAGWTVTIAGTSFGSSQGTSTVKFNGASATPTNWASNGQSITVPVPPAAPLGPGSVVVRVNGIDNTCSGNCTFSVIGPPALTSLSVSTAHISDTVTISGNNLMTSGTVRFNGTVGIPTSWNNTSISVPVPSGATTGPVVVTVSNQASNALPFTVIPPPTLTSAYPGSGQVGVPVTIWGANFGAAQGASTLKFNGTTAAVSTWSDTRIDASVPAGATTGNVVVTVSNQASTGLPFSVLVPGTLGGTVTRVTGGTGLSGATVQAVLSGVVKSSTTTAGNGTYSIANLEPGTYDVRVSATGFSTELRQGIVVTSSATTTVDAAMYMPGAVSGKVTQAGGITPIAGAAVAVFSGPVQKGSANTNATGDYTIAGLHPGALTVQAANVGYRTNQQGATVAENATATANLSLDPSATGPVSYVYDELGRLVSVIDPSGDAAEYAYDKVGNLLSIARAGATTVSISEFTPNSGPIGTTVTIHGTGFSPTPGSNTVTFGGTTAAVTAATANQLTVTAPAAGQIAVSGPNGSANTGSVSFTVNSTAGVPTITSISPQIWDGTSALTIAGTNFDAVPANDRVNLNIAFATPATASATSLSVPVLPVTTSGHVTVATIAGTAVSASDFFVPPPGYVAANLQSSRRITIGTGQPVSIPTSGRFAMLLFDGIPGHRVSATFTDVTLGTGSGAIYDPYGLARSTGLDISSARFLDAIAMPTSATYTLLVAATGASTGNATVTVYDVVDVTGTIVIGGPQQTVTIGTPGQNAAMTFTGTTGQRISLDMTSTIGGLGSCTVVAITKPDGSPFASNGCVTTQGAFFDVQSLTATGTYTVAIDPQGSVTGGMTLRLYDVPADISGTIVVGGASQPVVTNTPGQNASLTFTGTNLQRISLNMPTVTIGGLGTCTAVVIKNPDGSPLVSNTCITTQGGFIDVQKLTATGTYTIAIDPAGSAVGGMTLTLYDVVDVTGSVTINGAGLPVSISVPGANANITVNGTIGQSLRIPVTTPGATTCATVTLLRQDNVTSVASIFSCGDVITLPSTTLPATETYHVVLDPYGTVTGSYSVSVVSP